MAREIAWLTNQPNAPGPIRFVDQARLGGAEDQGVVMRDQWEPRG
jgi:hypothetical protein